MKKFQEYVSFESTILNELKKQPKTLLELCHRLKEDVLPVSSMLEHLKICEKVTYRNDDKWYANSKKKAVNGNLQRV